MSEEWSVSDTKQSRAEDRELRAYNRRAAKYFPKKRTGRSRKDQPSGCAVVGILLIGGLALLSL